MSSVNQQQATEWLDMPLADRAQMLRFYWSKKQKFGFRLARPPCEHEWLLGTVRHVSTTGGLVHINGGKGIGLVEVPVEFIIEVVTEWTD